MPKRTDVTGQTFGIWKVLEKTNIRQACDGCILYKCLNTLNNQISYKSVSYLRQFVKRNSKRNTAGRNNEYIIIKAPIDTSYKGVIQKVKEYFEKHNLNKK